MCIRDSYIGKGSLAQKPTTTKYEINTESSKDTTKRTALVERIDTFSDELLRLYYQNRMLKSAMVKNKYMGSEIVVSKASMFASYDNKTFGKVVTEAGATVSDKMDEYLKILAIPAPGLNLQSIVEFTSASADGFELPEEATQIKKRLFMEPDKTEEADEDDENDT